MNRVIFLLAAAASLAGCSAGFYAHHASYVFAGSPPKAQCGQGPGFKYCFHAGPRGDARDIVYFLHYANGSEKSWSKIPMARFVEVNEIAALVAWLASEDCSFTTGGVFDISGGRATY